MCINPNFVSTLNVDSSFQSSILCDFTYITSDYYRNGRCFMMTRIVFINKYPVAIKNVLRLMRGPLGSSMTLTHINYCPYLSGCQLHCW